MSKGNFATRRFNRRIGGGIGERKKEEEKEEEEVEKRQSGFRSYLFRAIIRSGVGEKFTWNRNCTGTDNGPLYLRVNGRPLVHY